MRRKLAYRKPQLVRCGKIADVVQRGTYHKKDRTQTGSTGR